jgi:hypothetical protein
MLGTCPAERSSSALRGALGCVQWTASCGVCIVVRGSHWDIGQNSHQIGRTPSVAASQPPFPLGASRDHSHILPRRDASAIVLRSTACGARLHSSRAQRAQNGAPAPPLSQQVDTQGRCSHRCVGFGVWDPGLAPQVSVRTVASGEKGRGPSIGTRAHP